MDRTIARWRLRNQHLSTPHATDSLEVVRGLLGVQAENPSQSAWAVATRTERPDARDLAALLASGEVLRTHVLRSTWHYVVRTDLDWMLALTGPGLRHITARPLLTDVGLAPAELERLEDVVVEMLADGRHLTRREVGAGVHESAPELADRVTGRVLMLLMAHLEMDRRVCSGSPRDGEHTYASWGSRVGDRVDEADFDRDAALARLAVRYFTGHGPATVKDLAYWATLTVPEVRRGLDAARDRLGSFEHDGRTYWHAAGETPPIPRRSASPTGHLLQLLDEMYRGYQDSRWVLDPDGLVPRGREKAIGIALVDGQLLAGMKRTLTGTRVRFDLFPHRPLTHAERDALDEAAARYADFLDRSPEVVLADLY